ncbi:alpha/beta hydrolase [Allokutzneria sp. A3M-2-11 16]|uniref:alpha/beta fold hydrolase n=1 Tax=Allokutzneria sp. A3M-2-11 16 TaxID=2962043 RepID=UPI0020B8547F|nr:alpha/beta hydrolase [Allokutzneria sp. A3M-2-11 16]MCP3803155.1 alpha/beta hydrolase [Allokutzneria sp. A3M-2-11 16]
MFSEDVVRVATDPDVALFVARTEGPADRALLVVHGGPDWDHSYLRDPLAELAGRSRLIMPDLRGCGRSSSGLDDGQYTPDAVVADLVALLDALGVARADVLGFSYGGLIAQRLALAAPDRVRRLIIASSSVLPVPADAFSRWPEREERMAAEAAVWSDPELSGPELTRAAAVAGAPANVWRPEALPGYLRRLEAVRFSAEWLRPWRAGTLPSPRCEDAAKRLAALDIPVLLVQGRQDMVFPAALAERAAALIPSARAVVLDEAGHMAHVDQPEGWLAAIEDFTADRGGSSFTA